MQGCLSPLPLQPPVFKVQQTLVSYLLHSPVLLWRYRVVVNLLAVNAFEFNFPSSYLLRDVLQTDGGLSTVHQVVRIIRRDYLFVIYWKMLSGTRTAYPEMIVWLN